MASPAMLILIETAIKRGMQTNGVVMDVPAMAVEATVIDSKPVYITWLECVEAGQNKDAIAELVNNKLDNIGVVK